MKGQPNLSGISVAPNSLCLKALAFSDGHSSGTQHHDEAKLQVPLWCCMVISGLSTTVVFCKGCTTLRPSAVADAAPGIARLLCDWSI